MKRDVTAGSLDVHALQTTINDHSTMINYLMNNSINFTILSDAISDHHSRTGPNFTSWRDIANLVVYMALVGSVIYCLLCGCRFRPFDNVLRWILIPIIERLEAQQPETIVVDKKPRRAKEDKGQKSIPIISKGITSYNHDGYMTD